MARILFYCQDGWAFGNVHNELRKHLWPEHDCDMMCWTQAYNQSTFRYLNQKYDYFWSTPEACVHLHRNAGVPYEKLIALVHSDWDIVNGVEVAGDPSEFAKFRGYAVINPKLRAVSVAMSIPRVPDILPIGVSTKNYAREMSPRVTRLGYFAKYSRVQGPANLEIKRGHLARQVAVETGLEFVAPQLIEEVHYLGSDQLYREIDILIFCSLTEGLPTTALEAVAAGIPVLGTDVGIFSELAKTGAGGILPFEESAFVAEAVEVITALRDNPELYARMHAAALETSKHYDWSALKPVWLEFLHTL
jgi:glycosyltransferase involved in cell wall biosynthesis